MITTKEAAARVSCHPVHIARLAKWGVLRGRKERGRLLIDEQSLERWAARARSPERALRRAQEKLFIEVYLDLRISELQVALEAYASR